MSSEQNTEPDATTDPQGRLDALVMPTAVGIVQYEVLTECPHCGKQLALNKYPYNDYSTEYSLAEDDLGLALFGTDKEPAKWTGLQVDYTCCGCHQGFRLAKKRRLPTAALA